MTRSPFRILLLASVCSYAFFYEYLPPVRQVHIPYDLEGYHHSLADYAFQQLKQGHWPQWDASIYSGMSFASNVQAALYYPGTWLMFLATWGRERLSYQSLEDLTLLHVPLAFTLCFFWLRRKGMRDMAAVLGAMVYAYSGYMCLQLQHFGLIVAYAWIPLALMGVDEAAQRRSWGPMWKVAVASALAFLGGYPPTWLVLAMVAGVYALATPGRWRTAPGVVAALLFSLALCGAQTLPTWEATHFREPELRYGIGIKDPLFYIAYLIPNYFDFGLNVPVMTNLGKEYLYLGAPGILGVLLAFRRRLLGAIVPALAMVAVSLVVVINPYAIVWDSIKFSALLADIVRSAYFLAGVTPGLALLAAIGLDGFLRGADAPVRAGPPGPAVELSATPQADGGVGRGPGGPPHWLLLGVVLAMVGWGGYELMRWSSNGFLPGLTIDAAVTLAIFAVALFAFRGQTGTPRVWMGVTLVLFVAVDYKAFGTGKRFNASQGQGTVYSSTEFGAMNVEAYRETRSHPDYRLVLHELAPQPSVIRHVGWTSPQGFDPFVSLAYRELGTRDGVWGNDRDLILDPLKLDVMERYGARFVITGEAGSKYRELMEHPRYRMVGRNDSYYKVFEYLDAKPIYGFSGTVEMRQRDPEHRVLRVQSGQGGLLTFSEQWYPGWSATVDGQAVPIEKWEIAFQAVRVPAGAHTIEFRYRERLLGAGIGVSLVSLLLLGWWVMKEQREYGHKL